MAALSVHSDTGGRTLDSQLGRKVIMADLSAPLAATPPDTASSSYAGGAHRRSTQCELIHDRSLESSSNVRIVDPAAFLLEVCK